MSFESKIIFLMGPTASGKTDLSLRLAEKFPIEIVSVDSALIYRDMNIGTAKPTSAEQAIVPHHLIDIINPDQNYSVAEFLRDAHQTVEAIWQRGKLPLLVGGTMMYYKAWQEGLADIPAIDPSIRVEIMQRLSNEGLARLYQELMLHDPLIAARLSENDTQRITRTLEVFYGTGKPLSFWQAQAKETVLPAQGLWLRLMPKDRDMLHQHIANRFKKMLAQGFIEEVEQLKQKYLLDLNCSSLRCVGYRQVWQYLQSEIDYVTMQEHGIIATRQLAKRQLTWLRQWQDARTLEAYAPHNLQLLTEMIDDYLSKA